MDRLAERAAAGALHGTVVIADHQTAGRGRFRREWLAPRGTALLMSVLFRPELPHARLAQVPMALALGALDGLADCVRPAVALGLKWPNDLVWRDLKLAGLLAETDWAVDGAPAVCVGLGLNVAQAPDALPPGATSLAMLVDRVPPRTTLAAAILNATEAHYTFLQDGGDLVPRWAEHLVTVGQAVTAWQGDEPVNGRAVGVSPAGGLIVRRDDGVEVVLLAGDVTLRAPAAPGAGGM